MRLCGPDFPATTMDELRDTLKEYVDVNAKLKEANESTADIRKQKDALEDKLAGLMTEDIPDKIPLTASELLFQVHRPSTYKKAWTLSKKNLEGYLKDLVPERAEEIYKEIVRRQEETLVATEFKFELKPLKKGAVE